ncbi:MAG: sulfate permease [Gammaproteobacteria bacterium]|nr:sulfate permease [Gammaproteobacteria bacterium]MDP2140253.1 sulfate permease [Gammaproteobacteria bacterium]MDP2348128.1 sulfate permease [Gammaproteobacteria bacterium]
MTQKRQLLPIMSWGRDYDRDKLVADLLAAVIVMVMLIPQSLAYALVAGLPPEMGLYASILPLMVYTFFGSSRVLSVGPVAVLSLMTAAALGGLQLASNAEYIVAALTLAFLSGAFLLILGLLRMGFLANFMSHPVVTGFITASAVIIILSQVQHLLGISSHGYTLPELLPSLLVSVTQINTATALLSLGTLLWLFWSRNGMSVLLQRMGMSSTRALLLARTSPVLAVIVTTVVVWYFDLQAAGIAIVGDIPSGLPSPTMPSFSLELWQGLAGSAALLAIIGFVESVSVAQGLAAKQRERIDPDQELIGLGASNIAAGFSGGFPVAGGFSRSVVNYDAGAATPAAGFFAAILIAVVTLLFVPLLAWLPKATLAATIIVAVWSLVDFAILRQAWRYSMADFLGVSTTIVLTLLAGVEVGVAAGILVSLVVHLYKTSRPHVAIVGELPGTEHFRNVNRHQVQTYDTILSIRIDESLYFANTRYLEDIIYGMVAERPNLRHVILMCTAVNEIDMSAMDSILTISTRLDEIGIKLHLSEVKGPVMDGLLRTDFLSKLSGHVFLSQHQAVEALK